MMMMMMVEGAIVTSSRHAGGGLRFYGNTRTVYQFRIDPHVCCADHDHITQGQNRQLCDCRE